MKKFYCLEESSDRLAVERDGDASIVTCWLSGSPHPVCLSKKDTLRLARHLIKLVEKMDD